MCKRCRLACIDGQEYRRLHLPIYSATPPNASVWIARQRLATSVTHFNSIFLLLFYYGNNNDRRATRSFSAATRQDVFRALLIAGSSGLAVGTVPEQLGVSTPVTTVNVSMARFHVHIAFEHLASSTRFHSAPF